MRKRSMGHLASRSFLQWPLVATLTLLTNSGLAPPTPPSPELAWIGTATAEKDRSFQRFVAALDRNRSSRSGRPDVAYVSVRAAGRIEVLQDLQGRRLAPPLAWVAPTDTAAWAAMYARPLRPVIFSTHPDPVLAGLVADPRRPGGQATGVVHGDDLHAKRLEVLRDAFPQSRTVAVLLDTGWLRHQDVTILLLEPARRLGLQLRLLAVDDPAKVPDAIRGPAVSDVDAWYVPPTYISYQAEADIIQLLASLRKPAMHATDREVAQGALMAYSQDTSYTAEALADLALRVAMGERAGDIPVQRPRRFVLSVRPRDEPAALRLPAHLVKRADRVH